MSAYDCFPTKVFDFVGQIFVNDLGPAQISTVKCGTILYRRGAGDVRSSEADTFILHLAQGGDTLFEVDGREVVVKRGDMLLMSTARPHRMSFSCAAIYTSLKIPRNILRDRSLCSEEFCWKALSGRSGLGAMLRAVLSETAAQDNITASDQATIWKLIVDLLTAFLIQARPQEHEPVEVDRLDRAKSFMLRHLGDAELNPNRVAEAAGLSLRSLHRLFADENTTFMRWLMAERIEASYQALADGRCRDVTDAAFSHGFKDLSHFSRTFRERFSKSPRSVLKSNFAELDAYTVTFVRNSRASDLV